MTRPLFVEPSSECEREDPWSGPQGFMIGGMSLPTKVELSQQFFDAATLLVEAIKRCDLEDYKLVNPVLYLYRHSLELMLKGVMQSQGSHHKLDVLADDFVAFIKSRSGEDVPKWITNRLKEIARIDPGSTAFRYAENMDKERKRTVPVDGEIYVGLIHLQNAMTALHTALAGVNRVLSKSKAERI